MNTLAPTLKPGSQNSRILARLRKAKGGWVGLRTLMDCSGSTAVPTRVSNINAALMKAATHWEVIDNDYPHIMNKTRRNSRGIVESFYRLVE